MCFSVCVRVFQCVWDVLFFNANVTEKAMAVEEMWSSCPPRLQPVGELRQRPLVVDHAQLPDITPDLRLVFVGLTNVRILEKKERKKKEINIIKMSVEMWVQLACECD